MFRAGTKTLRSARIALFLSAEFSSTIENLSLIDNPFDLDEQNLYKEKN